MLLFEHDLSFLTQSIERVIKVSEKNNRKTVFVEIGLHKGGTAEALINKIASMIGDNFIYYGIDPVKYPDLHPRITFINNPSHLAINDVPSTIDWVLVDGCHCAKCVIRDFVLYGSKLPPGGEICFHDASPSTQGRDPQDYEFMNQYHDIKLAKEGIAVRSVLDNVVKKYPLLECVQSSLDQKYGGVEIFRMKESY